MSIFGRFKNVFQYTDDAPINRRWWGELKGTYRRIPLNVTRRQYRDAKRAAAKTRVLQLKAAQLPSQAVCGEGPTQVTERAELLKVKAEELETMPR